MPVRIQTYDQKVDGKLVDRKVVVFIGKVELFLYGIETLMLELDIRIRWIRDFSSGVS